MKVLIARTDKLGDLILSLPVFAYLKDKYPRWEIHVMVAPEAVPLVENNPHLKSIWTWSPDMSVGQLQDLKNRLQTEEFDIGILLHYKRELATLFWSAGIKPRYGPRSSFSSWFLLNKGIRLSDSCNTWHQVDCNLKLICDLLENDFKQGEVPNPELYPTDGLLEVGRKFRKLEAPLAETVIFIHPGSGDKVLDWDPERFAGVANVLAGKSGCQVFITGEGVDRPFISDLEPRLKTEVTVLLDRYNLRDFMGVLSAGDVFIGPLTGPLHMAAALGLATVGLFPPIPSLKAHRWGPKGFWNIDLQPSVECPVQSTCLGTDCSHYNCMMGIYETDVIRAALDLATVRINAGGVNRLQQEDGN